MVSVKAGRNQFFFLDSTQKEKKMQFLQEVRLFTENIHFVCLFVLLLFFWFGFRLFSLNIVTSRFPDIITIYLLQCSYLAK